MAEEGLKRTKNDLIHIGCPIPFDIEEFLTQLEGLLEAAYVKVVTRRYSNGFVEGTNSRLKMIKRTMYGRCGKQLLEAKLRYMGYNNNNG